LTATLRPLGIRSAAGRGQPIHQIGGSSEEIVRATQFLGVTFGQRAGRVAGGFVLRRFTPDERTNNRRESGDAGHEHFAADRSQAVSSVVFLHVEQAVPTDVVGPPLGRR